MPVSARLEIAITDRNPHVRDFLSREITGLGHRAEVISGVAQLLEAIARPRPPQVLVLDPEAAGARLAEVERVLKERAGEVLVLLHVFEGEETLPFFEGALVVEKQPHMGALNAALKALAAQLGSAEEERA